MIASHDIHLWITDKDVATDDFNREILSLYIGTHPHQIQFSRTTNGKPFLKNRRWRNLCFSSSHSHGRLVTAISRCHQLGVDIEFLNRRNSLQQIAHRYFHPDEVTALQAAGPEAACREHFFRLWTAKEAWIKAQGLTIGSASLRDTGFQISGSHANPLFSPPQFQRWVIEGIRVGDHLITVAQARKHWEPGQPRLKILQID